MNRRDFVKSTAAGLLLLKAGQWSYLAGSSLEEVRKKKTLLRFAVASDGHYGQAQTDYSSYFDTVVSAINYQHARDPFAFLVFNGDIVHDDARWFPDARAALKKLSMPWYVSQGNHDHANADLWLDTWGMPVNHDVRIGRNSLLVATTSNERGEYLCPDLAWMEAKLDEHQQQDHIFVFLHITPHKWTKYGVECPGLEELFSRHKNVRAVFDGHDHDVDDIKIKNNLPYLFDGHIGGDWGVDYRGFRIVELKSDGSLLTWMMDPSKKIKEEKLTA